MSAAIDKSRSVANAFHQAPTTQAERIIALDALRGFALLGILVMNIQSFAMVEVAYFNPTAFGNLNGVNYWVWYCSHLLANQKFMTIFSILFGAGILMMSERQQSKGLSSVGLHYRRMGWLLVIGLLHAYLLWYGDILVTYAMCGVVVFLLRKLPPWLLLVLGIVVFSVASGLSLASGLTMPHWPREELTRFEAENWLPPQDEIDDEIAAYRGSWLDQWPRRARTSFYFQTFIFLIYFCWRGGGLMLIGMGLYRLGVLTGERSTAFYATLIAIGGFVGIPLIAWGVQRDFAADWDVTYSFFLGSQYNYWASLLVSMGYIGAVMLACRTPRGHRMMRPLASVGQMALTNYLMQTIVCTTIFYGHGFGQFARFSRAQQLLTVVAVWVFQLILSPLWLRYFRFGPFEWIWRSLSYGKAQPMRRALEFTLWRASTGEARRKKHDQTRDGKSQRKSGPVSLRLGAFARRQ